VDGYHTMTYRVRHRDGHYLWFETASHAIRETYTGAVVEVVSVSRDITARVQAEENRRRLAEVVEVNTDLVLFIDAEGRVTLAEIKTTNKTWRSIPRTYLRQVWWQQHVLGAERTLVVWEEHDGFVPVGDEPRCAWVDRDEREIQGLVNLATELIDELYLRTQRGKRPEPAPARPREPYRALALAD